MLHLDRRQEERFLGKLGLLPLEIELDRLSEVGNGLFDGSTLAGDVQLGTPRDEPGTFAMDGRGQLQPHVENDGGWRINACAPVTRLRTRIPQFQIASPRFMRNVARATSPL
jgi:hypothetical protein